jgi:predicted transcriptional regulator
MKTAVSIPDDVFHEADRVADRLGWSRSQLYTRAVRRFLDEQGDDPVTSALDVLADELGTAGTPAAARSLIDSGAWEW